MRLYLSWFCMGNHGEQLLELLRNGRRTALICNAVEHLPFRADTLERDLTDLHALDLREPGAVERLKDCDGLCVQGGHVFVLRHIMAETGADREILDLLARDAVVCAGFSAGPCVLSPDLGPLSAVDPLEEASEPITAGLGVLDRLFGYSFPKWIRPGTQRPRSSLAWQPSTGHRGSLTGRSGMGRSCW